MPLTARERTIAGAAGIAVFEDRLILDAQPPIDDETLRAVAARCSGALPPGLVALWRTAFGGEIDYRLDGGVSFTELFYPDSDGYQDLWGWIDHEAEIGGAGKLRFLPFGGFEYLDRVYVDTAAEPQHGAVVYWQQGLPPGWEPVDGDRGGALAAGVRELFAQLMLEDDPWDDDARNDAGAQLRAAVDDLAGEHPQTAAKLRDLVRATVLDWRGALTTGTIAAEPRLRRLAIDRVAAAGDTGTLERLAAAGCDLAEPVRNGLTAIDLALLGSRLETVEWLLARDVPVVDSLRTGAHAVGPDLARRLLDRGAVVTADAVDRALDDGDPEVIRMLAGELSSIDGLRDSAQRIRMLAAQARHAAERSDGDRDRRRAAILTELADRVAAGQARPATGAG